MNIERHKLRELQHELSRRDLLRLAGVGLSGLGLAAIVGCRDDDSGADPTSTPGIVIDPPPETTTIRLGGSTGLPRYAPIYLAEPFLAAEGFTDVQYVEAVANDQGLQEVVEGKIDVGLFQVPPLTLAIERGDPLMILAGVHGNLFELFGRESVQSLRDLKGKTIWGARDLTGTEYPFVAALLGYVGIDVETEVEFVYTGNLFAAAQEGGFSAVVLTRPNATIFRNMNAWHVVIDGLVDPPWSQQFIVMATVNRDFVEKHPAATKRALRAILKAADVCAQEPERAAQYLVDNGHTIWPYESALDGIPGRAFAAWREFDPEATMRFYALRLKDAGLVKSNPDELIARSTDWRYLNEIKRELGVA